MNIERKETTGLGGKTLVRVALSLLPALLIEILCAITVSMTEEIQGGEKKLLLLIHGIALLSVVLLLYKGRLPKLIRWASAAVAPALAFVLLEYVTHLVTNDVPLPAIGLNLVLYYLAALVLFFLFGRTDIAVAGITIAAVCVGYISYYADVFRGMPLLPWDIASAGTAMAVLGNYEIIPTPRGMFVFAVALFQILLGFRCNEKLRLPKKFLGPVLAALCCLLLVGVCRYARTDSAIRRFDLIDNMADPHAMYQHDGFLPAFLLGTRYAEEPEGYSLKNVREITAPYQSDAAGDSQERPNVIVIMNESWADLSVLCDYEPSEPLFPFIESLEENTLKGWAHVSVLGGNTPNSEFEFLTGLTMGFLPQGVIAYQQYVNEAIPSLATQFNALGYRTIGSHAFWSPSWNRDKIYPRLGFQQLHFQESFPEDVERLRLWITDGEMYREVEKLYESSQEPLFLFGITMMNHGGYHGNVQGFDDYVYIKGLEDNGSVREYMTLMRETDKAFEQLVNYFSKAEEKTVILMFGDHQPNDSVAQPLLEQAGVTIDPNDPAQKSRRYMTPYVLWANYDIDYDAPENISLNYLAAMLMDVCGLEKTAAQKYQLELMREYPVVTSQCVMDGAGEFSSIYDYGQYPTLNDYAKLQYNFLLDKRNRLESFWNLSGEAAGN